MLFRSILLVDEEKAAELFARLALSISHGELGIIEFKVEAAAPSAPKRLPAPKPRAAELRVRKHTGGERWAKVRPAFEKGPLLFYELSQALEAAGFARTGAGNAVKQWVKFGFIKKVGAGRYALVEATDDVRS